ncbi:hypothetical protein ACFE04_011793 [Oxalis oulophora]
MEELKASEANSSPLTPLTFLERAATVYGNCPSIIYNNQVNSTWHDTHRRCLQLSSSLVSSIGIQRGHVVSVLAPNIPAMYELHFAVPMAGAILNCINTRLDASTISVLLLHSESKLLFVDSGLRSVVNEALAKFPLNSVKPKLVLINDDDDDVASLSEFPYYCSDYKSLVNNGDPEFEWVRPLTEWDPMIMNYTSGTTSSPKGVVHSHRGIFIVTLDSIIDWSLPKQPVYLWTLAMFHANGWSFPWGMAAQGGVNICIRKFDAAIIFDQIDRHNVTHMCGAPVVLNMLCNAPDNKPLKKPVYIMTAGAPPPAPVLYRTESGGENLSSVEVETVLYSHPAINEAAVVARPDEFWGETPCAFVSLKDRLTKRPTEKEIMEHCRTKLPRFMVPKTVVFKDELPKTSTGKVQKFVLREIAKGMRVSRM